MRLRSGEHNPNSKLTEADVREMRELCEDGMCTHSSRISMESATTQHATSAFATLGSTSPRKVNDDERDSTTVDRRSRAAIPSMSRRKPCAKRRRRFLRSESAIDLSVQRTINALQAGVVRGAANRTTAESIERGTRGQGRWMRVRSNPSRTATERADTAQPHRSSATCTKV